MLCGYHRANIMVAEADTKNHNYDGRSSKVIQANLFLGMVIDACNTW